MTQLSIILRDIYIHFCCSANRIILLTRFYGCVFSSINISDLLINLINRIRKVMIDSLVKIRRVSILTGMIDGINDRISDNPIPP